MLTDGEIAAIRARFPIFRKKIYLNSCSQGALSDVVEGGIRENLATWHEHGSPWDLWVEKYEATRAAFASFIGAKPEEVAVVTSASEGMNAIAAALSFRERKNVVMGEFEFPTMGHVWLAQRPRGAQVRFLEASGNTLPAATYERAINRDTLIVPLTRVCFMNGFRSDVAAITKIAHENGALVMLDDFQDAGTRPIDVKALGVDFYITGTLKYLLGASGVAFLYVRQELVRKLTPAISGWFGQANPFAFDAKLFDPAPAARRFESGTPPVPSIYFAAPAIELLRQIGPQKIEAHVCRLTRALLEGAQALGLTVKTPADSVGPLVVAQCDDANAMVAKLAAQNIVVSARRDGLRISFHVYNTLDDVSAVLSALGG